MGKYPIHELRLGWFFYNIFQIYPLFLFGYVSHAPFLKNINKISNTNEVIKDFIATKACKAAVKGGQELSDNEINYLLNKIYEEKTTLLCPHGRPVCVKMTKDQIEKMFKRKV